MRGVSPSEISGRNPAMGWRSISLMPLAAGGKVLQSAAAVEIDDVQALVSLLAQLRRSVGQFLERPVGDAALVALAHPVALGA